MRSQLQLKRLFVFIFISCTSFSVAASCFIVGKSDTEIKVNGEDEYNSNGFFEFIEECDEVEVINGSEVEVCFKNSFGTKMCKALNSGQKIEVDNPGEFFSGLSLAKIGQILNPSDSGPGGRRLDEDTSIPGFPSGEILLPKDKLVFSVDPSLIPEGLNTFSLNGDESGTDPIFQLKNPANRIEIPAGKLEYGKTYRWVAQSQGKTYRETFRIAAREDQDDFESQLEASVANTDGSSLARAILKVELCNEFEYFFDRDQALREAYAASR
jgi:hypothetical protein